jgi:hypothetical protein
MMAASQSFNLNTRPSPGDSDVPADSPVNAAAAACGAALVVVLGVCLRGLAGVEAGAALVLIFVWMALPGVIIARRLFASGRGSWLAALLVGPAWGFALSSVVLLALWTAGLRGAVVLAIAPAIAVIAAVPAKQLASSLDISAFDRRDAAPIFVVLLLVPAVVGLPYAHVGKRLPEGKAYRAYFIADFEWAMSVAAEISKGDVPPRNPFLDGDHMHYYWLADLLSGVEHRVAGRRLALEAILLTNAMCLDMAFVAFLYFFVRQFVHSPPAAAVACVGAVLFSSFEGIQQLYVFWMRGIPFERLRAVNIDAISNWQFGSLKVDGLQRVLLYQPQHATAWALSLSGLVLLARARDNGPASVNLLAGLLLALALLVSPFIAVMVGSVVAAYQLIALAGRRRWTKLVTGAVAGGLPVVVAILVTRALEYVDGSGGRLVYVGYLNPVAAHNAVTGIVLSFGPALIAAFVGAIVALRRRATDVGVLGLIVATSFFFYFFVDVVDHQHAYVGWRAGHLLFIAFAPLAGMAWQELRAAGPASRSGALIGGVLLAAAAAPMTIVDLYNAQDIDFRERGPGFRWTEIVSPGELEALDWIKTYTPPDALVQPDPIRAADRGESGTWAYMPAFGARRMRAGVPISMIPLRKYQEAGARVAQVFQAADTAEAYRLARELGLQYVYIGPEENRVYPGVRDRLDAAPFRFQPVFRNGSVAVYRVT